MVRWWGWGRITLDVRARERVEMVDGPGKAVGRKRGCVTHLAFARGRWGGGGVGVGG